MAKAVLRALLRTLAGASALVCLELPVAWASAGDPTAGSLTRLLGGLLIVIALILIGAWWARRAQAPTGLAQQLPLKVVGSMVLSPRERIVVVEVDDQWLVLGTGPQGMRPLHTLPARPLPPLATAPHQGFPAALKATLLARRRTQATTPPYSTDSPSTSSSQLNA